MSLKVKLNIHVTDAEKLVHDYPVYEKYTASAITELMVFVPGVTYAT